MARNHFQSKLFGILEVNSYANFFFEKKYFSRIFMHAASTAVCSLWAYFVHFYSIKRDFDTYLQISLGMRQNEIFEKFEKNWKISV